MLPINSLKMTRRAGPRVPLVFPASPGGFTAMTRLSKQGKTMTIARAFFKWTFQLILLFVLFIVFFVIGSMAVAGVIPDNAISEPGLVPATTGLLIITLADLLIITALILASRWSGWKLAVSLALAYYGATTFMLQIETWYFLSSVTVGAQLLPRLFLMGIPTAFLFIPLAVWILGKGKIDK